MNAIPRIAAAAASLAVTLIAAASAHGATRTINFDDADMTVAPCNFISVPPEERPTTDRYASMGVTFAGPSESEGGTILNQCGNFGVTGHSEPNFLAFNTSTYAKGPETITFADPAHSVVINTGQSGGGTVTATAFNGATPVSSSFRTATAAVAPLVLNASRITSVLLEFTGGAVIFDDLTWGTAPISGDDSHQVTQGGTLTVGAPGVLGNDTDPDGDPLTAQIVSQPANGTLTLNGNGSFSYRPQAGFSGNDAFRYRASDGTGAGNEATVRIRVNALPAPPPPPPPPPVVPPPPPPVVVPQKMAVTVSFNFVPQRPKRTTRFTRFQAKNIPVGSTVTARCVKANGKRCNGRLGRVFAKRNVSRSLRLRTFKKRYRAGSRLEVIVSNSAFVTQIKIIRIRRGKVPVISTRCVRPDTGRRGAC